MLPLLSVYRFQLPQLLPPFTFQVVVLVYITYIIESFSLRQQVAARRSSSVIFHFPHCLPAAGKDYEDLIGSRQRAPGCEVKHLRYLPGSNPRTIGVVPRSAHGVQVRDQRVVAGGRLCGGLRNLCYGGFGHGLIFVNPARVEQCSPTRTSRHLSAASSRRAHTRP